MSHWRPRRDCGRRASRRADADVVAEGLRADIRMIVPPAAGTFHTPPTASLRREVDPLAVSRPRRAGVGFRGVRETSERSAEGLGLCGVYSSTVMPIADRASRSCDALSKRIARMPIEIAASTLSWLLSINTHSLAATSSLSNRIR
jgi:hypothetical protein